MAKLDLLLPFQTGGGAVRGRLARLGPAIDTILTAHAYPLPVAGLLAQTLGLTAVLAGALKYDGIFTLQAQSQGPVSLLVADMTSDGHLRGYARFDPDRLDQDTLLGDGYLAFTVDQGVGTERYQGIVELDPQGLTSSVCHYFQQSEQLDSDVRLAIRPPTAGIGWQVGALMVQRMPGNQTGAPILTPDQSLEDWRTATILMGSVTQDELTDPALPAATLAWRLFGTQDLTVWDPKPLTAQCRCSLSKVQHTLTSIPLDELRGLKDDTGTVQVGCEFCGASYVFDDDALAALHQA